jgi:hypothetical protein
MMYTAGTLTAVPPLPLRVRWLQLVQTGIRVPEAALRAMLDTSLLMAAADVQLFPAKQRALR